MCLRVQGFEGLPRRLRDHMFGAGGVPDGFDVEVVLILATFWCECT